MFVDGFLNNQCVYYIVATLRGCYVIGNTHPDGLPCLQAPTGITVPSQLSLYTNPPATFELGVVTDDHPRM